jgi:DNA-binding GntR family transcriptional regulator
MLANGQRAEIVSKLKSFNRQLKEIVRARNSKPGGIFDLDREFHRTIVESGAGPRLMTLHKAVEPQAERYWRLYASSIINDLHISVAEHDDIISAIVDGNAEQVERGLQVNWENGAARLAHVIEMFGERGSW